MRDVVEIGYLRQAFNMFTKTAMLMNFDLVVFIPFVIRRSQNSFLSYPQQYRIPITE